MTEINCKYCKHYSNYVNKNSYCKKFKEELNVRFNQDENGIYYQITPSENCEGEEND